MQIDVAPHVGAWIETSKSACVCVGRRESRPTWARGLKLNETKFSLYCYKSRPTWARGLKQGRPTAQHLAELPSRPTWARGLKQRPSPRDTGHLRRSRPTWARGLKHQWRLKSKNWPRVAPHVGAWIETWRVHSVRVSSISVAPHVGAWIETRTQASLMPKSICRAPRGRVD